jgi:hypothetical protein
MKLRQKCALHLFIAHYLLNVWGGGFLQKMIYFKKSYKFIWWNSRLLKTTKDYNYHNLYMFLHFSKQLLSMPRVCTEWTHNVSSTAHCLLAIVQHRQCQHLTWKFRFLDPWHVLMSWWQSCLRKLNWVLGNSLPLFVDILWLMDSFMQINTLTTQRSKWNHNIYFHHF